MCVIVLSCSSLNFKYICSLLLLQLLFLISYFMSNCFIYPLTALLFSCWVVSDSLQPMDCSTPGFPVLHYLLEFAQTHVHWVGDAIQPSHPLSPSSPPALNLSQHQGLFQWILISFRIGWFDLLAMQGALRNLLQHHSSKAPILRCSAFFMVQLSHPYMTTGKIIALIRGSLLAK